MTFFYAPTGRRRRLIAALRHAFTLFPKLGRSETGQLQVRLGAGRPE